MGTRSVKSACLEAAELLDSNCGLVELGGMPYVDTLVRRLRADDRHLKALENAILRGPTSAELIAMAARIERRRAKRG